jgi:hypothetical protein
MEEYIGATHDYNVMPTPILHDSYAKLSLITSCEKQMNMKKRYERKFFCKPSTKDSIAKSYRVQSYK